MQLHASACPKELLKVHVHSCKRAAYQHVLYIAFKITTTVTTVRDGMVHSDPVHPLSLPLRVLNPCVEGSLGAQHLDQGNQ